jgi:hypothetical protein
MLTLGPNTHSNAVPFPLLGPLASKLAAEWERKSRIREPSLHQLSPYIGKLKSNIASTLITSLTGEDDVIYDPFCGSGSVALESWAARRRVIATDLSPYAVTLTRGKLFPPRNLDEVNIELQRCAIAASRIVRSVDLRKAPKWVRAFYHPETLREMIAWAEVLRRRRSYFLLSCLLGIAHHQRPGFLSYPSSHAVPYLRDRRFPAESYPELYEYRAVFDRLQRKAQRSMKRVLALDHSVERACHLRNAASFLPSSEVNVILTSPPYMRRLDYGRDNRLRLWFLGVADSSALDQVISPRETQFLKLFRKCLRHWQQFLAPGGLCILVVGDSPCRSYGMELPEAIVEIATREVGGYSLDSKCTSTIPDRRRVRRGYTGTKNETVLLLRRST